MTASVIPSDTEAIWLAIMGLAALAVIHHWVLTELNEIASRAASIMDDHDKRLEALEEEYETASEEREGF